ncbi:MAG: phosphate signaling complex protein PhoU [Anaerolineales bacterium]|jgi:phosphate transport system protein
MTRKTFERELQRLQDEMLALASMVENGLTDSIEILRRGDIAGSKRLIEQDRVINKKRYSIESECIIAIATQQPMAGDLRILAAVLDITKELERIGDYVKGIARINLMIADQPTIKPLVDLPTMAEKARSMLHRSLDAFVERDVDLAKTIPSEDDEVDKLYEKFYQELMTVIASDLSTAEQANKLLWVAHNLERSADRVTNICERVVFTVTGETIELDLKEEGISGVS